MMRLGWAKTKYSISYFVQKTIRVNGKNKSQVVKRLGSEKYICKTYGVTDAKAWAKEQVRLMNEAEKEDAATFTIELNSGVDLVMDEQRRFNGGYLFLQAIYYELGLHKIGSTPVLMEMPFRTGRAHPIRAYRQRERSWL